MSTLTTEAIRKTVLVDFAPAEAFELFTTRVASWWPVRTHSYGGDEVTDVVFEPRGRRALYEVTDDGRAGLGQGARVGAAAPLPARVADRRGAGTEVEVRFSPEGPGRASSSSTAASAPTRPARELHRAAGTSCSRPSSRAQRARRRRRSAPRAGRRAGARRRARGAGAARTAPRTPPAPPASTSGCRSRTRPQAARA